ncbi:USP6 N-terminal-like protein [Vulpes lagopus]
MMHEDPETLLALQRANIVAQYHQSRDKELSSPSPHEAKKLCQETRRADKWIKMLKRWDHYLPSKKLRPRVYKGVPPQVRGQVWLRLLNIHQVKARNAGKYQEMKEAALVSSRDIMQIDQDVNRTFHSHTMFWDRYGVGQRALFHVLAAYSVYDTEVGYCQGMSKIAAILLMFLPEEDAFWALAQLMTDDRHAMHGLPEAPQVPGSSRAHPPKISPRPEEAHETRSRCPLASIPQSGSCSASSAGTPFLLTLKLWDVYMLDGEQVLTAMAYTILKVHRKCLLKLPLEGLLEFLQDSLAQPWALEDEVVLRHLRASMTQLQRMRCDHPPQRDLRSSLRGPWACSKCPRCPGLSSLLRPLSQCPGWRSRPPRAQPPSLSRPDPLPARPSSNLPPSDGTPSPPSQCNKTVQAGSPSRRAAPPAQDTSP